VADIQPYIIDTFQNTEKLPWIGAGIYLGAISILALGRAFAVFNVKWLFISVIILFEIGSVLCGAAPNMESFIVGRVAQGVGASGCYLGAVTFVSMMTTRRERPIYLSGIVATWSIGSVVGPVVGGGFAQSPATWRWAFYINLLVAAVSAPALLLCLPSLDQAPHLTFWQKLRTQDWPAITIYLGGCVALVMALNFGGSVYAFESGPMIALWTVAGVCMIAFFVVTVYHPTVELKHRLYPLHLLKQYELNILQLSIFVAAGCMVTGLYYIPLIFQFTRGDHALMAGVRLLPFLGGMLFFVLLNGYLMPRLGYYMPWYMLGNALLLVGSAPLTTIRASTPEGHIYGWTFLLGGGCGAYFTAGFAVMQALVPADEITNGISFLGIAQSLGQLIVVSIGGALFQNVAADNIRVIPGLEDHSAEDIRRLTMGTWSPPFKALTPELQSAVVDEIAVAIGRVFLAMTCFAALALLASCFMRVCFFFVLDSFTSPTPFFWCEIVETNSSVCSAARSFKCMILANSSIPTNRDEG